MLSTIHSSRWIAMGEDRVLHIRVSEDLHKFLRIRAAELDISITELVASLLEREKLKRESK